MSSTADMGRNYTAVLDASAKHVELTDFVLLSPLGDLLERAAQ